MERNDEQIKNVWKPLCIVFAALLALSWVFFGFLYSKGGVDFSTLEKHEQNYVADGGGVIIGESTGNNAQIMSVQIPVESYAEYGISPMAESAYQLTATITPDTADNKAVDWSVSFVNAESEWASGKTATDYVTVTPTSDVALTANVECLQAFGEQISVTVTSRDNESATANCTVDYAKRVTEANCRLDKGVSGSDGMVFSTYTSDFDFFHFLKPDLDSAFSYNKFDYDYQVGIGTLEDSFEFSSVLRFSDEFIESARSDLSSLNIDFSYESDYLALQNTGRDFMVSLFGENVVNDSSNYSLLVDYLEDLPSTNLPVYNAGVLSFELNFVGEYSSYQKVVPLLFSIDSIRVSSVSVVPSSIIL